MEAMIKINDICKGYDVGNERLEVLKHINLEVEKGDYLAILGPSGSGKSTLMNIIGCMDVADTGEYFLNSLPIHSTKEKNLT
jgi:putative ABC transport system ATP-binding protein